MYLEDKRVRLAAFSWLDQLLQIHGDVLPRSLLLEGFELDGQHVPLVSPAQGIFKPRVLAEIPISSMTSPKSNNNDPVGPSACFFAAFETR